MSRNLSILFTAFALFALFALPGCGGQADWEITVENKGTVPCSVFVTLRADGGSTANVENLLQDTPHLLVGGNGDTVVKTVKVVRGDDEMVITPDEKLVNGKRCAIVVDAKGNVGITINDK